MAQGELRTIEDVRGGKKAFRLDRIKADKMDVRALSARGRIALAIPDIDWDHAQTDHFVLHYERRMFARKVGRMAEFMYDYIAEELKVTHDQIEGRSHIFIFRSEEDWQLFIYQARVPLEWAFSMVEGPSMYLRQDRTTTESGEVLAHEMTHLVMRRFFVGRPPLWLDEGLAQWYEEFAYPAFKGIKKSRRTQFRSPDYPVYPLDPLFRLVDYPAAPAARRAFYETSKYLVGYLMTQWSPERIVMFTRDLIQGRDVYAALEDFYDIPSAGDLQDGFEDFIH